MPHGTPEARAKYQREYREKNKKELLERAREKRARLDPEAQRAYMRQWYLNNKEHVQVKGAEWRAKNRAQSRAQRAQWQKENPEKHVASQAKRKAQVTSGRFTLKEWRTLLEEFDYKCAYCQGQGKLEIEHMNPLSRGGLHHKDNIVPACGPCNRRKRTHNIFEFLGTADGL